MFVGHTYWRVQVYGIQFSGRQGTRAWFPEGMPYANLLAVRVTCSLFYVSSHPE